MPDHNKCCTCNGWFASRCAWIRCQWHTRRDDAMVDNSATIYRFRKQRGVNLGSWFVLERWITEDPFQPPAQSDYDVACGPDAKSILERHWDTWIRTEDWKWMSDKGINTVRIPIGFYHLCGANPSVLDGTEFAGLCDIFAGAWSRISNAISTARRYGIGVLVDLHAAPGKQNADAHSGKTGAIQFYNDTNLASTIRALQVLVSHVHSLPNVVGVQLLNEPQNHDKLPAWYTSALNKLRSMTPYLPLYIHDAWSTGQYARFTGSRNDFTVLDHHLYRCFTPSDAAMSGDDHAWVLRDGNSMSWFRDAASKCRGNIVVAEWSAALNPSSLRSGDPGEQDRQRRVFAAAQLELYEHVCAGWFFWTYKKGQGWDAGWSMLDATKAEILPSRYGLAKPHNGVVSNAGQRDEAKARALGDHTNYWSRQGGQFEHWRFDMGFTRGWEDAYMFFAFGEGNSVSELGFRGEWAKMRREQHAAERGSSGNMWEFEHGLAQGLDAARHTFEERRG